VTPYIRSAGTPIPSTWVIPVSPYSDIRPAVPLREGGLPVDFAELGLEGPNERGSGAWHRRSLDGERVKRSSSAAHSRSQAEGRRSCVFVLRLCRAR
jgi:hypothetical protein